MTRTLGIDFGTSNSSAAHMVDGHARLIDMTPGNTSLPTTFFFDFDTRETLMGDPANSALLNGDDGRFMRALKRILGTPLMHERRQILNDRLTFVDIIARFLAHIKTRAEAETGLTFTHALSGRPVVFHGTDDPREAHAEDDLRACYHAAGFETVTFLPEPEAAAIAAGATARPGEIGLIVDIGGGTSDFSVFRSTETDVEILANHGIRTGGTDFDRAISIAHAMPLLGRGTEIRNHFGSGTLPAPGALFNDLATWEKIPFLYTAQTRRAVDDMARLAQEPAKFARLTATLRDELGHDIAFAVEAAKIAANGGDTAAQIDLTEIERNLRAPLSASDLAQILAPFADTLSTGAAETIRRTGLAPGDVTRIVYVGGSSMMAMVPTAMGALLPNAVHEFSSVFTAVASGLALASARSVSGAKGVHGAVT